MRYQTSARHTLSPPLISLREDETDSFGRSEVVAGKQRAEVDLEMLSKHLLVVVQRVTTAHAAIVGAARLIWRGQATKKEEQEQRRTRQKKILAYE